MDNKISPSKIRGLSSTLLIPLWAKAVEFERSDALLVDAEAHRMLRMIDYDFKKFESAKMSQIGCCGRALIIDNEVRRFIANHTNSVVVQLGAGLDARFERLGKPNVVEWYDLDLPEVMVFRRQLLPETDNHYLEDSLFNDDWMKVIAARNKPVLLILEGVLMYFPESEVKAFLEKATKYFPQLSLVFDSVPPIGVGRSKRHDALRSMDNEQRPEFVWGPSDFRRLEQWFPNLKIMRVFGLSEVCFDRFPWWARLVYSIPCGLRYLEHRIVCLTSIQ